MVAHVRVRRRACMRETAEGSADRHRRSVDSARVHAIDLESRSAGDSSPLGSTALRRSRAFSKRQIHKKCAAIAPNRPRRKNRPKKSPETRFFCCTATQKVPILSLPEKSGFLDWQGVFRATMWRKISRKCCFYAKFERCC